MDQKKIGNFLKELRLSKHLTQEELAERFYVSSRSISRWETGVNLPDISLLIELADFYKCDVREIIEGERFNNMNSNEKDIAVKVANYANDKSEKSYKKIVVLGIMALLFNTIYYVLSLAFDETNLAWFDALKGFVLGLGTGCVICITLYASNVLDKIHKIKWLYLFLKILCAIIVIGFLIIIITTTWFK